MNAVPNESESVERSGDRDLPSTRPLPDAPETAPASPRRIARAEEAILPAGTVLDTYRVIAVLGQGGMGTVYLAHDEALDREVALKLVRRDLVEQPAALERFRAEARAMARLSHPNVVGIHALKETPSGQPYLVMERIPGMPLSRFARDRGSALRPEEMLVILDGVCRGVSALHAAGMVHRDLKPSNVLVGPAFRIVVADLGLAQRLGLGSAAWSTPGYAAPESLEDEPPPEDLARRIDVYSLGAMAYELLTGRLPFPGPGEWARALADLSPPLPPSRLRDGLGTAFDEPILAALSWSPELRPESVDAFRRALVRAASVEALAPARPPRIVVVDDDPAYATLAAHHLVRTIPGARVESAEDGRGALAAIARARPDLVLTDLDMPGMNGMELTAALRGDPATARLPVIVTSAVGGATDWSLLGRLGANAFLGKPYDAAQLALLVRMLLAPGDAA